MMKEKKVTHEEILNVMFDTDIAVDSLAAVAAIMGHVFRYTENELLTVDRVVGLFSESFDTLDSMLTDEDKAEAVKLLNRIVEL